MVMNLKEAIVNRNKLKKAMKIYRSYYEVKRDVIHNILNYYCEEGHHIAIWGAGQKGQAFLRVNDPKIEYIKCVYDKDSDKYNKHMPTGHRILDYTLKENQDIQVILIMNSYYENEIMGSLKKANMDVIAINIDSIIEGELTLDEAIELYS